MNFLYRPSMGSSAPQFEIVGEPCNPMRGKTSILDDRGIVSVVNTLGIQALTEPIESLRSTSTDRAAHTLAATGLYTVACQQKTLLISEVGKSYMLDDDTHLSFGTVDQNGDYIPQITLFNENHPIRQRIETEDRTRDLEVKLAYTLFRQHGGINAK